MAKQLLRRGLSLQMNITNSQISEIVGSIMNSELKNKVIFVCDFVLRFMCMGCA